MSEAELSASIDLFVAAESGNEKVAREKLSKFREVIKKSKGKSPFSKAVEEVDPSTASDDAIDFGGDLIETGSTAAGVVIGVAVAGPAGAIPGAVAGKASGRATASVWKKLTRWLWGKNQKSDGVVEGPNGEDCEPPLFDFGQIPHRL